MAPLVTVKALKCNICGHTWLPRNPKKLDPQACAKCKSASWNGYKTIDPKRQRPGKKFDKSRMSKRKVIAASVIGLMTLVLMFSSPMMAMAKSDSGGKSDSGSSMSSSSSSSDKGSGSSSKDKGGSNGDNLKNDDDHGPPSAPGNDLPGNNMGSTPNPHDDGFTSKDGPQPKNPTFPNDHINFCSTHPGVCIKHPPFPPSPDDCSSRRHHCNHNDVKVIQKTVVVHDKANNPQTIIVQANTQGQCIVTQQQISNSKDLLQTLLDQCTSLTILQQ